MKNRNKLVLILLILLLFTGLLYWFISPGETQPGAEDHNSEDTQVTPKQESADVDSVDSSGTSGFQVPTAGTSMKGYTIILHTNDTHGRVKPDTSKGQMGFTAVSALKKCYEAAGAEVILLDAGDTLHGTNYAEKGSGKRIVSILNLVGYDAMVPGNNDFNYGTKALLKREKKMDFHLLSANITNTNNGEMLLDDSIIIEKNGVKYGIFGLTTTDTVVKEDFKGMGKLDFGNPINAAKEELDTLKQKGADVVVALTHLGIDDKSEYTSKDVANKVSGINLIVDGHSHSTLTKGLKVKNTLIVSAGEYLKNIGVVTIDPKGSMKAELVNAGDFKGIDPAVDKLIESSSD
jgi:5'-nucleotidase